MEDMSEDGLSQAPTAPHHGENLDELPDGMTCTENGRPCLAESGSACLDFFFQVVPGISEAQFGEYFAKAWEEDANNALRLVFQLGNCRKGQGGKLDRVNFLRGLLRVWNVDPETLLLNVPEIVKQGCYKDLLDLLQAVLHEGSLEANLAAAEKHKAHRAAIRGKTLKMTRRREKEARQAALKHAFAAAEQVELSELFRPAALSLLGVEMGLPAPEKMTRGNKGEDKPRGDNGWRRNCGKWASPEVASRFHEFIREREEASRAAAKEKRLARETAVADRVANMTGNERRLYDAVAAIFAEGLIKDREQLASGAKSVSGLAAKWAPTCDHMHDRNTLIVDAIIALLPERVLNTKGSTARIRYQQACAEVRRAAKVPESFIGRGEWGLVDYKRMPSLCRKLYGEKLFKKHDEERYVAFLAEAKEAARAGKKPLVHTGALLPHMVTSTAKEDSVEADLQWHGLVTRLIKARAGGDAGMMIPVCDVSGSMSGEPMEVAIALSLLLAESAPRDSAVFGKMFSFHEVPSLLTVPDVPDHAAGEVPDGALAKRVAWVRAMPWGGSTNFDAVFDLLLELCLEHAIPAERVAGMNVCVFSDMQFDEARGHGDTPWETAHEAVVRKWREAGYPSAPRIVYWNLRAVHGGGVPADSRCEGVVMLSGFSSGLLEAFLAGNLEQFTPMAQMLALLSKPCYARLRLATPGVVAAT